MENISGVNYAQNVQSIQQPSFQGRRKEEYYVSQPIEQKEDGDKKLWGTLAAIGATAAAGIYIAKGKSGPAKAIRNGVKNLFGKGAKEAAEKTAKKGSKEAIEQSKKVIKGISTETQENINKLTNGVTDVLTNQKAYDEQQNIVRNLQAKVTAYQDAITAARNASQNFVEVDGRKINLSKAEGWLGGFKGELRTAQATLDKMTKPSDDALSNAVKAVQEANTGEGAAIIQMQRQARKHPGLSDSAREKIAKAAQSKSPTEADLLAQRYNKYKTIVANTAKKNGKDNVEVMSLGEFETKVKQIQANAAERGKQGIENLETFAKNNIMKDLPQKKRKIVRQALGEAGVNIGDLTAGDMDKIAIAAKSGGKAKVIEVLNEIKARIKS